MWWGVDARKLAAVRVPSLADALWHLRVASLTHRESLHRLLPQHMYSGSRGPAGTELRRAHRRYVWRLRMCSTCMYTHPLTPPSSCPGHRNAASTGARVRVRSVAHGSRRRRLHAAVVQAYVNPRRVWASVRARDFAARARGPSHGSAVVLGRVGVVCGVSCRLEWVRRQSAGVDGGAIKDALADAPATCMLQVSVHAACVDKAGLVVANEA